MDRKPEPHDILVALLSLQSLMERRSETFFEPYGLTGAQFNILNLLGYHSGRLDQAALVEKLLVGKSSISIVLNRMVRDGLVQREPHARDRRQVVLLFTSKGRALWKKIAPRYEASVSEIFGVIPARQRREFIDHLKSIHDALRAGEDSAEPSLQWPALLDFSKPLS